MQATVPVHSSTGKLLMPTSHRKANALIARGRAVRRFDRGLFYIVLTDRADGYTQPVALGIDPGSKKEAFTLQGEVHTYLNLQADAVTWVKESMETRKTMRRGRRYRHAPNRACRPNRRRGHLHIPPSTRARWGLKVRIAHWLARHFPITRIVIEDIAAATVTNKRRWNASFSPLQVGKEWAYSQLEQIAPVTPFPSPFTKALRDQAGLHKSEGLKRGSWVRHPKWGLAFVGGASNGRVSLHSLQTGKRLCQNARASDCQVHCTASWRIRKECAHPPHP